MTDKDLQAIEARWQNRNFNLPPDVEALIAEVRRLQAENEKMRCCGNCHYFMKNPKTCAGCVVGSKWEAAGNG